MAKLRTPPLILAVRRGDVAAVRRLAANPANLTAADVEGYTPMWHAVMWSSAPVVEALLDAGLDPDAPCSADSDRTPLHKVAYAGRADVVALLLARGAAVDVPTKLGTALSMAAANDQHVDAQLAVARLLLDAGADPDVGSPLTSASASSRGRAMVDLLLDRGADVNGAHDIVGTALHVAVREKDAAMARHLISRGADPAVRTPADWSKNAGLTAAEYADALKHKAVARAIREATAGGGPAPAAPTLGWAEFEARLRRHDPEVAAALAAPATAAKVKQLEKEVGAALPDAVRAYFLAHDGSARGADILDHPTRDGVAFWLLPVAEARGERQALLDERAELDEDPDEVTADPGVRRVFWHDGWVPFASTGNGDFLLLDLAPAAGGAAGQVLLYDHESLHRGVIAGSFEELLATVADGWK